MRRIKLLSLCFFLLAACKKDNPSDTTMGMSDCSDVATATGFPAAIPGWEVDFFETGQHYYWGWQPYFLNETTGFIFEANGHVLKTEDGGNSWKEVLDASYQAAPRTMFFVDEQNGFLSAQNLAGCPVNCDHRMTIYRTTDGGDVWHKIVSDQEGIVWGIYFSDTLNGIGTVSVPSQDYRQSIVKTKDGGNTWEVQTLPGLNGLTTFQMQMLDDVNGFFPGSNGILYHTADGGETFDSVHTPIKYFSRVKFSDPSHGLASDFNKTYRTADGGNTWELLCERPSTLLHLSDQNEIFAIQNGHQCVDYDVALHDAGFFTSTNGGDSWIGSELSRGFGIPYYHFPLPNVGFGMYGSKLVRFTKK